MKSYRVCPMCNSVHCIEFAVYGWGPSIMGVGSGLKSKDKMIPRPVVGLDKKVRSLAVGSDHCAVVTGLNSNQPLVVDDGSLYTWGRNGKYECGLGHGDDVMFWLER